MNISRRHLIKSVGLASLSCLVPNPTTAKQQPNIILCMTDDQGWGDTGYNGHPILKTPNLDAMSREGITFTRWYSGAPVCSPTRGSCLTGRHPYRYGIYFANSGHIKSQEFLLAEALKEMGYTTGHFGKWHLGTLTTKIKESNRGGPRGKEHYAPPWENGFDACFSTEAKVPTYNPMINPQNGEPYRTYYWTGPGQRAKENLEGDDSRIIMDRAIPFIKNAAQNQTPFFAVIWFHTPHLPVVAGEKHRALYKNQNEQAQHYYGCISAMDEQVGRLRTSLKELGVYDNTMLWFCSDNGPEGKKKNDHNGSAKHLRGRKRSLYEGGVRVPGLMTYPAMFDKPKTLSIPCSTSDYLPTILDMLGYQRKGKPEPIDGISLLPILQENEKKRPFPIAFESRNQLALIDNRYKIYSNDKGKTFELYDIVSDPSESQNLAGNKPDLVKRMKTNLLQWRQSCERSNRGEDY
ncbi:sulfatase-like hydrolase/transferase [bacterium]|nr:sulfatase-like hydrolase/transferase [bacterium]